MWEDCRAEVGTGDLKGDSANEIGWGRIKDEWESGGSTY